MWSSEEFASPERGRELRLTELGPRVPGVSVGELQQPALPCCRFNKVIQKSPEGKKTVTQTLQGAKAPLGYVADSKAPSGQPAAYENLMSTPNRQSFTMNIIAKPFLGWQLQRADLCLAAV